MSVTYGEELATILDIGINLLPVLPEDHIIGVGASYFGEGGMLTLEQSPYLEDADTARLRIMGAVAGLGTHIHLLRPELERAESDTYQLPDGALNASYAVGNFVRTIQGNLWTAELRFETDDETTVKADVSGVFTSDDMKTAYLETLGKTGLIVHELSVPATAETAARITHTILTPTIGQLVTFSMGDRRPSNLAEMQRLKKEQG